MTGPIPQIPTLAEWDRALNSDPSRTLDRAEAIVASGAGSEDRCSAAMAAARCLFELGRLPEARTRVDLALGLLATVSHSTRVHVVLSASAILAEAGRIGDALAILDRLAADSEGVLLGRVHMQRSYVLHHAGRLNEALIDLDQAERLTARSDDARDLFRIHVNRGVVLLQQGRLSGAEADFLGAERIAERLGMTVGRAQCATNLGVLHGRARRLTDSLRWFDTAERWFHEAGNPRRTFAGMLLDRAEMMLYSDLLSDAAHAARRVVDSLGPTGNLVQLGDAQLILARVELAARRYAAARRESERARELFLAAGRPQRALLADMVLAEVALAGETPEAHVWPETSALSRELEAAGWQHLADGLRIARVRKGRELGEESVLSDLPGLRLGAFSTQRNEALTGWYAEAIARTLDGDRDAALDACTEGLAVVDAIVAETSSLEQRSAAMRMGEDLSQLAIDLAVELGDADTVLSAAEGTRARALHDELQERRPHRPLSEDGAIELRRELAVRLGDRTLVEWVVSGGDIWAIVFDADQSRLVRVASARDVVRARDRVLVWLDVATTEPDGSSLRARRAAASLDELLLVPLELPPDNGVVIVPVGPLYGMPWAGLPTFAGRPMAVTPSARLWLQGDRRAASPARTVGVVVGPEIESADVERDAIVGCFPGAALATGPGSTVSTVRSMFGGFDLVHVAVHGRFRSDRPLLSTLRLHEGDAPLGDVVPERIGARLVVLSSCEGGAHGTTDGSEVLGFASVLLARGAASVAAPLTVVRDLECADFVGELHAELARGTSIAGAVANVAGRWLDDDDLSRWAVASSFACFGSGASTVAP